MDGSSLFDIAIQFGASGGLPYINILYNDHIYNLLSFLEINSIYTMLVWMRDLIGAYYLISVIVDVIAGIPHIIRGKWTLVHSDGGAFSANVEGYRWDL